MSKNVSDINKVSDINIYMLSLLEKALTKKSCLSFRSCQMPFFSCNFNLFLLLACFLDYVCLPAQ